MRAFETVLPASPRFNTGVSTSRDHDPEDGSSMIFRRKKPSTYIINRRKICLPTLSLIQASI